MTSGSYLHLNIEFFWEPLTTTDLTRVKIRVMLSIRFRVMVKFKVRIRFRVRRSQRIPLFSIQII